MKHSQQNPWQRLNGGACKPVIVIIKIKEKSLEWINELKSKMLQVSRKMIQIKAKTIFCNRTN